MWRYVIPHFTELFQNLELTQTQRNEALFHVESIGRCLCRSYYPGIYDPSKILLSGSYGKGTVVRPPSDIDIFFILPSPEFFRVNRLDRGQSQLLQEVKNILVREFPRTEIRADGQVVKVPFLTFAVEVVPAFEFVNQQFTICDTSHGGSWKISYPFSEYKEIQQVDASFDGKATHLIKLLKAWKNTCNVELKSLILEIAACAFIKQWSHRHQNTFWYDWMVRDFFAYLLQFQNGTAWIAGSGEPLLLGDIWVSKCVSAMTRAAKACEHERLNQFVPAEEEWEKIFGQCSFNRALLRLLAG